MMPEGNPIGGWTPDTLYVHFTRLRDADHKAVDTALEATKVQFMMLVGLIGLAGTLATIWNVFR